MSSSPPLPESSRRGSRRLLVIDDDVELCALVETYLKREEFAVDLVHDGQAGLEAALHGAHQAIVLDVMLPGLTGFEVLQRIREHKRTPILMLTARGDHVDRIVGLEMGADDYISKPFDPRELVARIRAVLRRVAADPPARAPLAPRGPGAAVEDERLEVGDMVVNLAAREAHYKSRALVLTRVEFDLLGELVRSAGRLLTRDDLARAALGRPAGIADRSIDVHIANLRRKIGKTEGSELIRTVRSAGFIYSRPTD